MIVQHNITSMNANKQLGIVGNNLAKSTEKLSSGYRINRAADDAAGLAISEKMRAQVRGLNRASDNAQDGIASTKGTTDGTVIENGTKYTYNSNIFTVKASYTTENGNGKKISQDEVDSLSTNYDTAPTDKDEAILAKYGYSQDATGAGNLKTDIDDADNKSTAVTDVDGKAISGLLDNVDSMIKSVTTERSKLGAVQNRLEYTVKVDDNTSENLQSAESRIRDTDMADEMTRFSKESILQQAATSMLAQANQSNQGVLSLLQ